MNKVFTIIIKANSTLTQFLRNVMIVSATRRGRYTAEGSGAFAHRPHPSAATVARRNSSYRGSVPGALGPHQRAALPLEQREPSQEAQVHPLHTRWARRPRAAPRGPPCRGGEHNTAVGGWGAAPARGGSLALAGATSFPGQATARAQTDGLGLGDLGSKKLSGKGSRNRSQRNWALRRTPPSRS